MHGSLRSSSQPVLALTNYVLVQEDDFWLRTCVLVELVFGENLVVFPHSCRSGSTYQSCGPFWHPWYHALTLALQCMALTLEVVLDIVLSDVSVVSLSEFTSSLPSSFLVSRTTVPPCMQLPCTRLPNTPVHMM